MTVRGTIFGLLLCSAMLWGVLRPSNLLLADSSELLSAQQQQELFNEANRIFRRANLLAAADPVQAADLYQKALLRFERLVRDGGIRNGMLYYNIGNTYFRLGDIGRAILNYRRARPLLRQDHNLAQNLNYARSRRLDKLEDPPQTKALKTLLFWHYDLTARVRAGLFGVCFCLFWLAAALRLFKQRLVPSWLLWACAAMAALPLSSLLYEAAAPQQPAGVVVAEAVTARKGDGSSYAPAFSEPLHSGAEVLLLERRGRWLRVRLPDGRSCWLPESGIELL